MHSTPISQKFPQYCLSNSSSVCLIGGGPFSSSQERLSTASSFHASTLCYSVDLWLYFSVAGKDGAASLCFLCVLVLTYSCIFQLLEKQGATCSLEELGDQTLPDGSKIELPPVLLGQLGTDPKKKTLLVYGHLDVQPAFKVSLACHYGPIGRYCPH